jgi:hypothetical protein
MSMKNSNDTIRNLTLIEINFFSASINLNTRGYRRAVTHSTAMEMAATAYPNTM